MTTMPIIKSKGRKDTNYKQLVGYVFQHDAEQVISFTIFHNMNGIEEQDTHSIIKKFNENDKFRKKRKGGVGMYHEVLSFGKADRDKILKHPMILEDVGRKYLELRVRAGIAIVKPHFDKEHIHLHVVFTPNEKGSSKSLRMTKAEFRRVRRTVEEYQRKKYPSLTDSYVHSRDKIKYRQLNDQKNVGEKNFEKEKLQGVVSEAFKNSESLSDFAHNLKEKGIQPYYRRGIVQGIIDNGRKHRITTLLQNRETEQNNYIQLQRHEREMNKILER